MRGACVVGTGRLRRLDGLGSFVRGGIPRVRSFPLRLTPLRPRLQLRLRLRKFAFEVLEALLLEAERQVFEVLELFFFWKTSPPSSISSFSSSILSMTRRAMATPAPPEAVRLR